MRRGELEEAEQHVSTALGYFRATENLWREIECLRVLGDITLKRREAPTAVLCYVQGMRLAIRIGAKREIDVLDDCLVAARVETGPSCRGLSSEALTLEGNPGSAGRHAAARTRDPP